MTNILRLRNRFGKFIGWRWSCEREALDVLAASRFRRDHGVGLTRGVEQIGALKDVKTLKVGVRGNRRQSIAFENDAKHGNLGPGWGG